MKKYLRVTWEDAPSYEPVIRYHEIDVAGEESKRVEEFANGELRWADAVQPEAETSLSVEPLPPTEEIATQPEFEVQEIDSEQFELAWSRARAGDIPGH